IPIIFVGSNTPLLDDYEHIQAADLAACKSDAWDNVADAIMFAFMCNSRQMGGVFLSFAGRIHYPINVTKIPRNERPQHISSYLRDRSAVSTTPASVRIDQEPFVFSNALSRGRFAYRQLHGHIINNFDGLDSSSTLPSDMKQSTLTEFEDNAYY